MYEWEDSTKKDGPFEELQRMIGLQQVKEQMECYRSRIRMVQSRKEKGLETPIPSLHAAFMGSPGTGKTTVARLYGQILHEFGLLSKGHVVYEKRSTLMGQNYASEQEKILAALEKAKGGVLFIDEAYLLDKPDDPKDPGRNVLETLLTEMGDGKDQDWALLLAGYPEEMKMLLQVNPGLASRIPYVFHFEDYTADELLAIARSVVAKMDYHFTSAALSALRMLVEDKLAHRTIGWGNARFIIRLISNTVIPRMGKRLLQLPPRKQADKRTLLTICKCDIPLPDEEKPETVEEFDEPAIRKALKRLDEMVGLAQIKQSIHNMVEVARHLQQTGRSYAECCSLRWNFLGRTGTGKSTVAEIMGELLKALNILEKGHLVEVKAEEFCHVSEYKADEILKSAMLRARQGLLFIDGDASVFARSDSRFNGEELRFKLSSLTAGLPGTYALIIAEHDSNRNLLTRSLRDSGMSDFNHTFYFPDYTQEELFLILQQCLVEKRLSLSDEAAAHLSVYLCGLCTCRELGYANARTMKLIADAIAEHCWLRAEAGKSRKGGLVRKEDVQSFVWKDFPIEPRIGFK